MLVVVAFLTESVVVTFLADFEVVVAFLTENVVVTFLADFEVVVAFLVENVVDEQSNMGAHFVSQCFVVMCVGLLLVIALRIWVIAFLVFVFRILSSDKFLVNRRNVICAWMCQNQPRRSVSRVIVAHVSAAPLDKCVYEFVHVSARSQGTDICLY